VSVSGSGVCGGGWMFGPRGMTIVAVCSGGGGAMI
jgi:hypothetical protein